MKVNVAINGNNSADWSRVQSGDFSSPPEIDDASIIESALELGDLVEPLGFDGLWVPDHFGTPYGMSPNPLQVLTYFAGRTERISFGTMVLVLPWWHPVRLAHQIAYLDIVSKGRYNTIGLGRGVAKSEFGSLGIPREESRERFDECLDILELALTQDRFEYDGQHFKVPPSSLRPKARSTDLTKRFFGASSTNTSLEVMARRGLKPLFVGNKPLAAAAADVRLVNKFREEEGLEPCQSKNILFMHCVGSKEEARKADEYIASANRDVALHYGFGDPSSFAGIKGYEAYAAAQASATAVTSAANKPHVGTDSTYDLSNLLVGTPDEIIEKIRVGQNTCSFSEITIHPHFGTMPRDEAAKSLRLFAQEVLPVVHKMEAPLHASALPQHGLAEEPA